ncbi:hypothetical protein GCM10025883_39400 [Mobilicoccus caccae]|uniref:Uncharacterized protein n=1 Tax=Mobilicoccus caccae TaxID=1859295 RepID=A0ABQ6IX84_9MICO|nr:hypothetical protein GCM10025883_39400 [Mobilicoccus caccae]
MSPASAAAPAIREVGRHIEAVASCSAASPVRPGWKHSESSTDPTTTAGFGSRRYGRPSTNAVPESASANPRRILMVVDLPAPLGPRNPTMLPAGTVKETSSKTVRPP